MRPAFERTFKGKCPHVPLRRSEGITTTGVRRTAAEPNDLIRTPMKKSPARRARGLYCLTIKICQLETISDTTFVT